MTILDPRRWRRRNYFIKKGFQARFILKFLAVMVAGIGLSGIIVHRRISARLEDLFYSSHIRVKTTAEIILPELLKIDSLTFVLVLAAVAAMTVLLTHRIAGPLFRFERNLARIASGDFNVSFKLRGDDELKTLGDAFDEMKFCLNSRFKVMKEQAERLRGCLAELKEQSAGMQESRPITGYELTRLKNIEDSAGCIREKLGKFTCEDVR
ncbi:MAG: methyl-accepting chemotaxis protein [Nitrospirota bacterium]